jgi:predicted O-methyltransferase YrrM
MRHSSQAIDYIRQLCAIETPLQQQVSENLKATFPQLHGIQIGPEEGKLLQLLIKLAGVKSIVEIGSLAGYSALWMADALPPDGVLHAINKDPAHYRLLCEMIEARSQEARKSGSQEANIIPHLGDAREVLKTLEAGGPYDMVFIDADKPGYTAYLDWAEQHVRQGGLIVGDNTLLFGTVWQNWEQAKEKVSKAAWDAMREFNARLADASCYDSILIPTEEGMTVGLKRF